MQAWPQIKSGPAPAASLRRLREAALADEEGTTLNAAVAELRLAS
jgi:hypothetical protein